MKKVVLAIDTNSSGGAERVMVTLANYMCEHGVEVKLVNADSESSFYPVNTGVDVKKMNLNWSKRGAIHTILRMVQKYRWLRKFFITERPDAALAFLYNMEIPAILAALTTRTKIYTSIRNSQSYYPAYVTVFRRMTYPKIAGVIFQSKAMMNILSYKKTNNPVVLPNPLMGDIDKKLVPIPYGNRKKWIINVARLMPQKNQAMLLDAFAKIAMEYPDVELHIFGEGKLREKLETQISEMRLEKRVFLEGNVKNAIYVNRDALMFVMSSDHEGFPNALVESMVCGIPSISTDFDTGIAAELISDGDNGLLCRVGDANDLARKMKQMLDAKEQTDIMAKKASDLYDELNRNAVCQRWVEFLNLTN